MTDTDIFDEHTDSRLNSLNRDLKRKLQGLQRQYIPQGQSGAFCQHASDLMVEHIRQSAVEMKEDLLNKIKTEKTLAVSEFKVLREAVDKKIKQEFSASSDLLVSEVKRAMGNDSRPSKNILESLGFESRCRDQMNKFYNQFEAELSEYLSRKKNEEMTLQKAEEANKISKSSQRAAWVSGAISFIALIVSMVAFLKK